MCATTESEPTLAELAQQRDRLRAERDRLVAQRRTADREAEALPVLLRASATARRDRDGSTSPRTARHRATFEQVLVDVEQMQTAVARTIRRVIDLELTEDHPLRRRVYRAADQGMTALAAFARALNDAERNGGGDDHDAR